MILWRRAATPVRGGGYEISRLAGVNGSVGWSGQGDDALAGEGFGPVVGFTAGLDHARVAHEASDGGGGHGLPMIVSNLEGWMLRVARGGVRRRHRSGGRRLRLSCG